LRCILLSVSATETATRLMSDSENEKLRQELTTLQQQMAELKQHLRMRESERDLLAVMLNEAENAVRKDASTPVRPSVQLPPPLNKPNPAKVGWSVDTLPIATVLVSRRGSIKMSNRAAEILTGFSSEELKELFIYQLLGVSHLKELIEKMAMQCQNKVVEAKVQRKDGTFVPTYMTMSWPADSYYAVVCFLNAKQISPFLP
ncbi:MAG TPA: PAS domain S-box protein, partial [Chroococcales cyanobacterium]